MKLPEQSALTCAVRGRRAAGKVMRQNLWSPKKINSTTHHDIKLELDVRCQKLIEKDFVHRVFREGQCCR